MGTAFGTFLLFIFVLVMKVVGGVVAALLVVSLLALSGNESGLLTNFFEVVGESSVVPLGSSSVHVSHGLLSCVCKVLGFC